MWYLAQYTDDTNIYRTVNDIGDRILLQDVLTKQSKLMA